MTRIKYLHAFLMVFEKNNASADTYNFWWHADQVIRKSRTNKIKCSLPQKKKKIMDGAFIILSPITTNSSSNVAKDTQCTKMN